MEITRLRNAKRKEAEEMKKEEARQRKEEEDRKKEEAQQQKVEKDRKKEESRQQKEKVWQREEEARQQKEEQEEQARHEALQRKKEREEEAWQQKEEQEEQAPKARDNYKTFDDRMEDLKWYKETHDHANLPIRKLGTRVLNPNKDNVKHLTNERIAAFDAIGFNWTSQENFMR
jgi:hypothetical protein